MKKTFLLIAALIIGATSANAQRFISADAMTAKDKAAVTSVAKPFKKQVNNAAKDFVYGTPALTVSFDDPTQYVMENLAGHTAGTSAGMFHRLDTSATSTTQLQSTFPRFYTYFGIANYGYMLVSRYISGNNPTGNLIGNGYALVSPRDIFSAEGTNTKTYNTTVRITEPISTMGFNTVDVVFNQYTMRFNSDRYFIDYSESPTFATYDSIEFNVRDLELGSNDEAIGQKIVTLPVAKSVDKAALYIRFRYACNSLDVPNQPSGYYWVIDEVNVYDGPEYRINLVSSNHYGAAYGIVPTEMEMENIAFVAVVENTGGNTLYNASVEERFHNATTYTFPNQFGSFLDLVNISDTPKNITTAVRVDTTRNSAGAITAIDIRRHVELEAESTSQYNDIAGLYGISAGVTYLETASGTNYSLLPMEDSLYYRVSAMPAVTDAVGTARWASDVDVLIEGKAWAYGFQGNFISENSPGARVAGYEVCNRFMTPSNLTQNKFFAKGIELVPAADSCDAGIQIQVSLKYADFEAPGDEVLKPYLLPGTNTPVLSAVTTVNASNLNNGIFTQDGTEWTSTYNSLYIPFEQEGVVLDTNNWYYACYKLLDDGRFLVGRDDREYLPNFQTFDWWSSIVYTPGAPNPYAWGYPFGQWLSNYNKPMIRLMVSKNPLSITDVNNNMPSFNLNAYPNPAQNETTIEYTLTSNSNVVITVTDIMGRQIVRLNEGSKGANSVNRVALNTANINNGTYFYTINANGIKETKKLVINK